MATKKKPTPVEVAVAPDKGLNLREAPKMDSPVLAVLPKGVGVFVDPTQLPADGTVPEWLQVTTGKLSGFVVSRFLEKLD